jgi:hypothetical protein
VHVGIVTMGYPPLPHVEGYRANGFAEELARQGATVTVITTGSPDRAPAAKGADLSVGVRRFPCPEYYARLSPQTIREPRPVLARKARTALRIMTRGAHSSWARRALSGLSRFPLEEPLDVVWAMHGSDSAHAVANALRHKMGIPWVADFEDNWDRARDGLARPLARLSEARRLRSARAVTSASDIGAQSLEQTFARPVTPVYTGVDPESWQDTDPERLGSAFNIVYTGHVDTQHMWHQVAIDGLARVLRVVPAEKVRLHYFGWSPEPFEERLRAHGDGQILSDHGYVDHDRVVRAQCGADLLLYLPPIGKKVVCAKYLEYVASGRHILSIPGEEDEYLARLQANVSVGSTEAEVADTVIHAFEEWERGQSRLTTVPDLNEYRWSRQTTRLMEILSRAAGEAGRTSFPENPAASPEPDGRKCAVRGDSM